MDEYTVTVKQEPSRNEMAPAAFVVYSDNEMSKDILLDPEDYDKPVRKINSSGSRNTAPSAEQINKLIRYMELEPRLARGYARTSQARIRTREQWRRIAAALNRGNQCVKTWAQWSKYWKDKKGGVKRKASKRAARERSNCSLEDVPELTEAEKRILSLADGPTVDPHKESDPLAASSAEDQKESMLVQNLEMQLSEPADPVANSVGLEDSSLHTELFFNDTQAHQPEQRVVVISEETVAPQRRPESSEPSAMHNGTVPTRRFIRIPRRQFIQQRRIVPPQLRPRPQRSQLANITERFLALEEKRMEAQLIQARSQEKIVAAINKLTDALVSAINRV